ncbi:MAG: ATP-binding protein [Rhodothermales bacterium]
MIQLLEDLLAERIAVDGLADQAGARPADTFIENIVEEVSLAYDHLQITTRGNIDGQEFMIDRKLFRLIMNNLINNALKYSSHPERPIDIHSRVEKDVLTVCIADQGIGVPEHEITHLFEAFHRAGNVGTRQGTGLGLAIVKGAIDRLAGTINVASMENQGTTFTFTIPLATAANEVAC